MSQITLRPYNASDITKLKSLQPEGWEDIRPYFKFFSEAPFCYPIVAEREEKIVGVANCIDNGTTGWLSHVIVDPFFRNRGIGYSLTKKGIDILHKLDCKAILIIATKLGEHVYRKFGFDTIDNFSLFRSKFFGTLKSSPQIKVIQPDHVPRILALDRKASGEDRKKMILSFLDDGQIYEENDGTISGFFLPKLGEGPIVAENDTAGVELLRQKINYKPMKIGIPQDNNVAQAFLLSQGFKEFDKVPKMVLGQAPMWNSKMIYSRVGGYFG